MKPASQLALLLLVLCACNSQPAEQRASRGSPAVVLHDCRRADDPAFSVREQALIASARHHLEQEHGGKPVDAYYRLTKTAEGYQVYVQFVTGYQGKEPVFMPGAFCVVLLNADGTIKKVLPGA